MKSYPGAPVALCTFVLATGLVAQHAVWSQRYTSTTRAASDTFVLVDDQANHRMLELFGCSPITARVWDGVGWTPVSLTGGPSNSCQTNVLRLEAAAHRTVRRSRQRIAG